jgi:hypothetical protein
MNEEKKETLLLQSAGLFLPRKIQDFLDIYHVGNDKSTFYITNWTLMHFLSGVLIAYILSLYKYKLNKQQIFITAFLIHTAWEIWQIFVGSTPIYTTRGQLDFIVDTLAFMLGVALYVYLKKL